MQAIFFKYQSRDNLIEGVKMGHETNKNRPIILCRGGNRSFGAIDDFAIQTFIRPLVKAGFCVYVTQYSGGPNSEGHDAYGGEDYLDVIHLLAEMERDGVDFDDFLGVIAFSRGSINACRAIQSGLPATTAVFIGGVFDLTVLLAAHRSGRSHPTKAIKWLSVHT